MTATVVGTPPVTPDAATKAVAEVRLGGGLPRLNTSAARVAPVLGAARATGRVDAARPPPARGPTVGALVEWCAKRRLRHPSAPAFRETCELQGAQARSQILLEQFEEAALVMTGRVEDEVIEPGIRVLLDLGDDLVGV